MPEHVDLELPAQILQRDQLERSVHPDPRVVDERVEAQRNHAAGGGGLCLKELPGDRSIGQRTPASTVQPALARRSTVARPMPVKAPVMRATGIA
jgi:hypothetical protein